MTDIEYISAFRSNNQKVISLFYDKFGKEFKKIIQRKFNTRDEDLIADVFQDTMVRFWENIQLGKLTESNLTTSIGGYLYGIGEKVMLETIRKNKEISIGIIADIPSLRLKDNQIDLQVAWEEEVETPMRKYKECQERTREESLEEWLRLSNLFTSNHKYATVAPNFAEKDWENSFYEFEEEERRKSLKETVNNMGEPCASLLVNFYWNELSWDKISKLLGYANANSAKTQKNKCMNKLKALFR